MDLNDTAQALFYSNRAVLHKHCGSSGKIIAHLSIPLQKHAHGSDVVFTDHKFPTHMCEHFANLAACFPSRHSLTVVVQIAVFIIPVLKRERPVFTTEQTLSQSSHNRHQAPSVSHQPLAAMFSQPKITEKKERMWGRGTVGEHDK